ncbi:MULTISPECIES: hypothetical protein [Parvibaculum]|jgi:hypothetical protein|uniref:Uncharacterized protein n=1 Tax=Parvibaculum lavamentivorans (strain DS-1 / DSM 13023 / NCIMB 13966) TaxID=402881 RepID=A7HU49_PARL1|nr:MULTISPECIES: hypothetical protein [Parvibaculum]ABS63432.1 hypothetical protein Plav_1815 [Parvibaculum lavamentivorans DS-1]MCW5726819.1 hypothetical protein [Parvibaculum sp.]MDP1628704.1 hypothetical protein [Parvibaculum sp.]MDP2150200.1 hypothetical protein [Parvibaculum sp.]MDP3328207.1 hypothetical protein [Parvibaculum sp.]|tara:strand:+ start:4127 stop:4645 length:519 start_codon:yes stop_codon:yes gene_type:complete
MKKWTVQCGFAAYYANTVTVEAETFDAALEKAIVAANESDGWKPLDDCGPTFIDAVAEGDDADPWREFASSLPVPPRFSERGEPVAVTVTVSGGTVQQVEIEGGRAIVHVHDYDTEGAAPGTPGLHIDADGGTYALADWSNFSLPHETAESPSPTQEHPKGETHGTASHPDR